MQIGTSAVASAKRLLTAAVETCGLNQVGVSQDLSDGIAGNVRHVAFGVNCQGGDNLGIELNMRRAPDRVPLLPNLKRFLN